MINHNPFASQPQSSGEVGLGVSVVVLVVKKTPTANAGDVRDVGLVSGLVISPGLGHGYALHYSCLKNPTDRGAWLATVHRVSKSWTQLKRLGTHGLWVKRLSPGLTRRADAAQHLFQVPRGSGLLRKLQTYHLF